MRRFLSFVAVVLGAAALFIAQDRAAADASGLSSRDITVYKQAFAAIKKDRWKEARRIAATAKDPLPAKVIQWLDLTRPGPGRDFREMSEFLRANPDWPLRYTLTQQAERAMPEYLQPQDILKWFGERDPLTVEGAIKLAGALSATRQEKRAEQIVWAAWIGRDFNKENEQVFLQRFGHLLHPQQHWARLDRLMWDGERDQALRMLDRVDANRQALAEARLKLAREATDALAAVAAVPAELRKDAGLIFEHARLLRRQDKFNQAAALLDPPPQGVLRPDTMWAELKRASRGLLNEGNISAAYRLAAAHGTTSGESFAEGEFMAGWIALRFLQDAPTAMKHFTALYAGTTSVISQSRGAYWAGRAAEQMGDMAKAQDWYKTAAKGMTTFYGQLAAAHLNDGRKLQLAATAKPTAQEKALFDKKELVRVVRMLTALGEGDRTRLFLTKLMELSSRPAEYQLIAALAMEINRKDFAVVVAKEARTRGTEMIDFLYPVITLPSGHNPEPALVLGIIRQESAFDVGAVSSAGARGLMQLLPGTAKGVAKQAGVKFAETRLTSDSHYNITLGKAYLDELLSRFGGSYVLTAAAYNAGPSRVRNWISTYGDPRDRSTDVIDWIESIPFDETRNYVMRIIENTQVYRARLNGDGVANLRISQDLGIALKY
ncbi:lytic transglycosylase domain-containing protein [Dongia deserti]|uniref:lytic transglycosylase domain-containing protein n=1 Tax=Dongia deserti TaxID=2268030 RepID=UPI0013C480E7|nr:lytic transglycosylase domain-containing protein [Dongia deserti]